MTPSTVKVVHIPLFEHSFIVSLLHRNLFASLSCMYVVVSFFLSFFLSFLNKNSSWLPAMEMDCSCLMNKQSFV